MQHIGADRPCPGLVAIVDGQVDVETGVQRRQVGVIEGAANIGACQVVPGVVDGDQRGDERAVIGGGGPPAIVSRLGVDGLPEHLGTAGALPDDRVAVIGGVDGAGPVESQCHTHVVWSQCSIFHMVCGGDHQVVIVERQDRRRAGVLPDHAREPERRRVVPCVAVLIDAVAEGLELAWIDAGIGVVALSGTGLQAVVPVDGVVIEVGLIGGRDVAVGVLVVVVVSGAVAVGAVVPDLDRRRVHVCRIDPREVRVGFVEAVPEVCSHPRGRCDSVVEEIDEGVVGRGVAGLVGHVAVGVLIEVVVACAVRVDAVIPGVLGDRAVYERLEVVAVAIGLGKREPKRSLEGLKERQGVGPVDGRGHVAIAIGVEVVVARTVGVEAIIGRVVGVVWVDLCCVGDERWIVGAV